MRRVLHIFDSQDAPYDPEMVQEQKKLLDCSVESFDLNQARPDYDALLDKIFSADCVEVW
jgi:hypothetical protein